MQAKGKGATIQYAVTDSPLDRMLVARTDAGLCAVAFGDEDDSLRSELRKRYPEAQLVESPGALTEERAALLAALQPGTAVPSLPFDLAGTPFERNVWAAMAEVPPGTTIEYGQFATRLGLPRASRAVGAAVGKNPLAVLYPCHRLVAQGGALHCYRWGLERKRWLLASEGAAQLPDAQAKLPLQPGTQLE